MAITRVAALFLGFLEMVFATTAFAGSCPSQVAHVHDARSICEQASVTAMPSGIGLAGAALGYWTGDYIHPLVPWLLSHLNGSTTASFLPIFVGICQAAAAGY
jgi:hypothetical protein